MVLQLYTYSGQSKGVELKVPICCDNCEKKVKECFEYMDGEYTDINQTWLISHRFSCSLRSAMVCFI